MRLSVAEENFVDLERPAVVPPVKLRVVPVHAEYADHHQVGSTQLFRNDGWISRFTPMANK
jgi:hypothetical protein